MPNENSGALFSLGSEFLGSAIGRTDEDKKLFSQAGQTIGNILQTRFYDKQADDFVNNELPEFQKASEAYQNMMASIDMEKNPNGLQTTFNDWRNKVVDPFIYKMSTRYGRNEKVMGIVNSIHQQMMTELDNFIKINKAGEESQMEPINRAKGTQEIAESKAREALYRRQAQGIGEKEGQGPESAFDKRLAEMPIPPGLNPSMTRYFAQQPNEAWKAVDARTNEQLASKLVSQLQSQKAIRPDGRAYGETPEGNPTLGILSDKDVALDEVKKTSKYQKYIEAGRVATAGPYALYVHNGYYDDVMDLFEGGKSIALLPEERARLTQLQGTQDAPTVLAVVTGTSKNNFQGIESIQQFNEQTLDSLTSPAQLGGPIATTFESAVTSDHNNVVDREGNRIKTYAELKNALMKDYTFRVAKNLVSNDPGSSKTMKDVILLGEAAVNKFGPDVANKYGIEVPASALDKAIGAGLSKMGKYWMKRIGLLAEETKAKLLPDREEVEIK